jgi:uncharacterized protein (TIGR02246 family)
MKRSRITLSILVTTLTLLLGFGLAQGGDAEAMEVVEGVVQQFEDAVSQQDAAAFAQLYTENGTDLTEGSAVVGREAIQQYVQGGFDAGLAEVSVEVTEAGLMGDTAYGAGTFISTGAEGEVFGDGNWTGIYKQEAGEWKIHRLMGVSKPAPEGTTSGGAMSGGGN